MPVYICFDKLLLMHSDCFPRGRLEGGNTTAPLKPPSEEGEEGLGAPPPAPPGCAHQHLGVEKSEWKRASGERSVQAVSIRNT